MPRCYKKLTNSTAATIALSGFTHASLHLTEYWTLNDTPTHAVLSIAFIMLLFGGPGMVKGYLTLRTGNAWVHLWGFHAIWPHLTDDTPIFVKIFDSIGYETNWRSAIRRVTGIPLPHPTLRTSEPSWIDD